MPSWKQTKLEVRGREAFVFVPIGLFVARQSQGEASMDLGLASAFGPFRTSRRTDCASGAGEDTDKCSASPASGKHAQFRRTPGFDVRPASVEVTSAPGHLVAEIVRKIAGLLGRLVTLLPLLLPVQATAQPSVSAQNIAPGLPTTVGEVPQDISSGKAVKLGKLADDQGIELTIVMMPHRAELAARVESILDPHSDQFRHFLSFAEWKAQYAPSDADVAAVTTWSERAGLASVSRSSSNLSIVVSGTVRQAEDLLSISLDQYSMAGQTYFSNDRAAVVPPELATKIVDILGLSSFKRVRPASALLQPPGSTALPKTATMPFERVSNLRVEANKNAPHGRRPATLHPAIGGPSGLDYLEPANLWSAQAYNFQGLAEVSHCCNPNNVPGSSPKETTIAIIGADKPLPDDVQHFFEYYNLASNYTLVEVGSPACCDQEMTLDVEWAGAMSNSFGASSDTAAIVAYAGDNTYEGLYDAWDAALSGDKARVASSSYAGAEDDFGGIGNPSISAYTDITRSMTAIGWTIVAATGDSGGDADCSRLGSVQYPASDPNVVAAGGTTLTLTANPNLAYASETAWSGNGCAGQTNGGGGGGGCSNTFFRSAWQPAVCANNRRALPDLALNAGNQQVHYYSYAGCTDNFCGATGTSIVAPELAGFFAQENSYLLAIGQAGAICGPGHRAGCGPLGQPLAALYAAPNQPHNPIYDITAGCTTNGQSAGFCAVRGYDRATGLGSTNMLQLAWALNSYLNPGAAPPVVQFSGPTVGNWYPSEQTVRFQIVGASMGLAGYTAALDRDPGNTTRASTPSNGTPDPFWDGPQVTGSRSGSVLVPFTTMGCHQVYVRAWDNLGQSNTVASYGPICIGPFGECSFSTSCMAGVAGPPNYAVTCPTTADFWQTDASGDKTFLSTGLAVTGVTNGYPGAVLACWPGSMDCKSFSTEVTSGGWCPGSPPPPPPPACRMCGQSKCCRNPDGSPGYVCVNSPTCPVIH